MRTRHCCARQLSMHARAASFRDRFDYLTLDDIARPSNSVDRKADTPEPTSTKTKNTLCIYSKIYFFVFLPAARFLPPPPPPIRGPCCHYAAPFSFIWRIPIWPEHESAEWKTALVLTHPPLLVR